MPMMIIGFKSNRGKHRDDVFSYFYRYKTPKSRQFYAKKNPKPLIYSDLGFKVVIPTGFKPVTF